MPTTLTTIAVLFSTCYWLLSCSGAGAWTASLESRRRFSTLHLGAEDTPSSDHSYQLFNRREALSRGLLVGGTVISPSSSLADSAISTSTPNVPQSSSSSISLLSEYHPTEYKTLPTNGRTVFPPSFLPPLNNRATYRYSLGRNAWALEQLLAFQNVTATIRTNVIKLEDGTLWVCNPLWPTEEYCALLDELGPVKHAVLGSNALEHKAAMKQFLAKYPNIDDVWLSPGQYGPFGECGIVTEDMNEEQVYALVKKASQTMGYRVDGILPVKAQKQGIRQSSMPKNMYPTWSNVFDYEVLCVQLPGNAGPVSEVAFVHKPTSTLIVTDAVICVPSVSTSTTTDADDSTSKYPLQPIFSTYFDETVLSDATFWQRTVLQAVFLPLRTDESGTYPGFDALKNRLVRAPILRAFTDSRAPDASLDWVKSISSLKFDRIVTSHFASPINAGPALFTEAFAHLDQDASLDELASVLPPISCQDWSTLNSLNEFIDSNNLGAKVVYDFKRECKD